MNSISKWLLFPGISQKKKNIWNHLKSFRFFAFTQSWYRKYIFYKKILYSLTKLKIFYINSVR